MLQAWNKSKSEIIPLPPEWIVIIPISQAEEQSEVSDLLQHTSSARIRNRSMFCHSQYCSANFQPTDDVRQRSQAVIHRETQAISK